MKIIALIFANILTISSLHLAAQETPENVWLKPCAPLQRVGDFENTSVHTIGKVLISKTSNPGYVIVQDDNCAILIERPSLYPIQFIIRNIKSDKDWADALENEYIEICGTVTKILDADKTRLGYVSENLPNLAWVIRDAWIKPADVENCIGKLFFVKDEYKAKDGYFIIPSKTIVIQNDIPSQDLNEIATLYSGKYTFLSSKVGEKSFYAMVCPAWKLKTASMDEGKNKNGIIKSSGNDTVIQFPK